MLNVIKLCMEKSFPLESAGTVQSWSMSPEYQWKVSLECGTELQLNESREPAQCVISATPSPAWAPLGAGGYRERGAATALGLHRELRLLSRALCP